MRHKSAASSRSGTSRISFRFYQFQLKTAEMARAVATRALSPKLNVLFMRPDAIRVLKSLQSGMDPKHIPSEIIECGPFGPLSPYIDSYVRLLNEEGYAPASVRDHVRVIVRFSRALQRSDCEIRDLDEAVVERFLPHKPKSRLRCAPPFIGY